MKKFTFKGVLDGFRQSVQPHVFRQEQEIPEHLRIEHFAVKRTFRHGFPYSPTAFAFDPVQRLLAIGDKSGFIRILGRPGVDAHAKHEGESECAVILAEFLINEGALVTVTADDTVHLWSIRQKTPQVVQSLKFQRERITCIHLPVGSKWLYVGTERGNIHVVHVETFSLSGYIINWNKAIEVVRTSHPGAVIALCDNPIDANKLLIAFECGLLVLWDLKSKSAELRWQAAEPVKSVAWHYEGKYFVSSHTDGSICTWPTRPILKPQSVISPHAKISKEGVVEKCKPIYKVDLKTSEIGETFTIFSGGMPSEKSSKSNCITVVVGKSTTVLEMEHVVVDFIILCQNPWLCETQEPYAIAVLLQYDLVLIDLLTPGFPCFESPYPMDLHESPVTCCTYLTDCPSDLVPAFYSVGRSTTSKKAGFSEREWPINGGEWFPASCSYSEIVITGHQDGTLRFWDAGAGTLQILYKLKTAKVFEKPKNSPPDSGIENPLAVQHIHLCSESRRLCVAGSVGHVMLFKFRKAEVTSEVLTLEIPILYENFDDIYGTSPECDFIPHQVQKTESSESDKTDCPLKVKIGLHRKPPGFQTQLVCLTTGPNRRNVQITSICINSSYGLMAYGTEYGLVVIDIVQKICLLSAVCPDLYGANDPYSRNPRSPKRIENKEEQSRSPSSDQIHEGTAPIAGALTSCGRSKVIASGISSDRRSKDASEITLSDKIESGCDSDEIGNILASKSPFQEQIPSSLPSENTEAATSPSNSEIGATAQQAVQQQVSIQSETLRRSRSQDKLDGSFSRSRSSSMSSIDMSSSESVTSLAFIESYGKKIDGSCLATYLSNGHLTVHSLPSLRLLLDTDFLPLMELSFQTKCKQGIVDPMLSIWGQQIIVHEDTTQISKIFCFSHKGHGLYMATPTEIQKFTISSEFCHFILDMMGELYTSHEMPEQPKDGFFKGLFGGGTKSLDREELFGEQSGKANRSVAKHIPGPNLEQLGQRASTAASEISRAHQLAMERGEKLNLLEERAERMANQAQDFSGTAHQLMLKYKDKKWYQL
ncbi:syntaxin-binding protein 5 isoform X10 [Eurosta solidaginis]|uniref:syntaxin-binding protein 5 isoform X10 n=1 Tax=Eurosta solidaginis TaxID=178769 RepID=UPI003530C512